MTEKNKKSKGLWIWENPKNGFTIIRLHYGADPAKGSPEWVKEQKRGMSQAEWNVEMELSRENFGGNPVYGKEFQKDRHVPSEEMLFDPDLPIFRGWDFGGNQSVVICQINGRQLRVLDELPDGSKNTLLFAPKVIQHCNLKFSPKVDYIDVIDPSGFDEGKTATGKACADIMRDFDLHPIPGIQNVLKRIMAVTGLLTGQNDGEPCFKINPNCQTLIRGFEGGYHYPEKERQNQRVDRPLKNEFSHTHDALQYVATRMNSGAMRLGSKSSIMKSVRPKYTFGRVRIAR